KIRLASRILAQSLQSHEISLVEIQGVERSSTEWGSTWLDHCYFKLSNDQGSVVSRQRRRI
ncbi:hypothetical protein P9273_00005, partial [Mesorhizobium sp. WSM4935]|uniref:hypothetical protein n=1 Tax=Mesorhizobium sp. WSM4935 TaxID=3038547 RepID=UPI002414EDB9